MITKGEKFLLMVLANAHQDRADRRTYPKVATIAEDAMVCERQAQRLLASLERKGVLRREYPNGTGRDRLTYYFFLELDEDQGTLSAVKKPAGKRAEKGDKMSPLFEQEGRQKGDIRVTSGAPGLISKYNEGKKDQDTPLPPVAGGSAAQSPSVRSKLPTLAVKQPDDGAELDLAAEEVMRACGFSRRRLRGLIRAQIRLKLRLGEAWPSVAARMIQAWGDQGYEQSEGNLRFSYGADKFFGDGLWDDRDRWPWDAERLEAKRAASPGGWTLAERGMG